MLCCTILQFPPSRILAYAAVLEDSSANDRGHGILLSMTIMGGSHCNILLLAHPANLVPWPN